VPDDLTTIKLTEREIDLLHQCISTNIETVKRRHPMTGSTADLIQELGELSDDLLEQKDRADDPEWSDPDDPDLLMDPVDFAAKHDREGKIFMVAEDDFIQRGIDAREKAKANSRAATRRSLNLKDKDRKLSAQQQHDVWDANDPRNW
jgi:hypothetical protein